MSRIWNRLFGRALTEPRTPLDEACSPNPIAMTNRNRVAESRVFDPALKHLPNAFRPDDPTFTDPETAAKWATHRRLATDHILRGIAESPLGRQLVLRGSRLLRVWLGPEAREPGDLDWVADGYSQMPANRERDRYTSAIANAGLWRPWPVNIQFHDSDVTHENIWAYERASGIRTTFSWETPGLPGGTVQVDVVFGERMADEPVTMAIPVADRGCVAVRAATPEQSLAWKYLWLETDMYPQGKDLYDATLLSERFQVPVELLHRTYKNVCETINQHHDRMDFDWDNFILEYPWVRGTASEWYQRYWIRHVRNPHAEPLQELKLETAGLWLSDSTIQALVRGIAVEGVYDRLPILADALEEAGFEDVDVLSHLRAGGPHPERCFVVDTLLKVFSNPT